MKRKTILSVITGAALLLLAAACTNDNATQVDDKNPEPGTEGLTAFVMEDNATEAKPGNGASTRTTAEYDGSGLNFYWTPGDRLWVNRATSGTPDWKQDKGHRGNYEASPKPNGQYRATKASFFFEGSFAANEYKVRYTGQNGTPDKVTIANNQVHKVPGIPDHFATSGDCGVATAKRKSDKSYSFMLDHKAAYITFMPYSSQEVVRKAYIRSIKVTADKAICGQFDFNDNGIDTLSRPAATDANKSIKTYFEQDLIATVPAVPTSIYLIVIAPGTYSKFTVEYKLYDPVSSVTGTITKTYSNVTFTAGKNKRIRQDLKTPQYVPHTYMWGAYRPYWGSVEPQYNVQSDDYPKNNEDWRWYDEISGYTDNSGNAPAVKARAPEFRNCPNINEALWYVEYGDPHWDNRLWEGYGVLMQGGMWIKKQSAIVADNPGLLSSIQQMKDKAPDGINYTRNTRSVRKVNYSITQGVPENIGDYFFLPAFYTYYGGRTFSPGRYWTCTPQPLAHTVKGYCLDFAYNYIRVPEGGDRRCGYSIFGTDNEDKYRPDGL